MWHRGRRGASTGAIYIASVIAMLILWEWAARFFNIDLLFPGPSLVAERGEDLLADHTLISASVYSLVRILAGFILGGSLGAFIGLLMGSSPTVNTFFGTYVDFFRFIPVFAWFGPIVLWVGANEYSLVVLIAYATFFVVVINTLAGVTQIPQNSVRVTKMYGATRRQTFLSVTLPGTMSYIFTGLRLGIGSSFMTVVAAEFLQANNGLGFLLSVFQTYYDMPGIFSAIICLGILGFAWDRLYVMLVNRFGSHYLPGGHLV